MPRVKKSKAKKAKASISINIKNIMKQVQKQVKEQPKDYIRFVKNPHHELNFGSRTRLLNPAVTYASTPLSSMPSLASVVNAPPIPQIASRPAVYRPDILQEESNKFDITQSRTSERAVQSTPSLASTFVGSYKREDPSAILSPSYNNEFKHEIRSPSQPSLSRVSSSADFASPIKIEPRLPYRLPSNFFNKQDDSELLVSKQMDQDVRSEYGSELSRILKEPIPESKQSKYVSNPLQGPLPYYEHPEPYIQSEYTPDRRSSAFKQGELPAPYNYKRGGFVR